MTNNTESGAKIFFWVLVVALIVTIIVNLYYKTIHRFLIRRRCILDEMYYATSKEEYEYWENNLKGLYASAIPIFGKLIIKRRKK